MSHRWVPAHLCGNLIERTIRDAWAKETSVEEAVQAAREQLCHLLADGWCEPGEPVTPESPIDSLTEYGMTVRVLHRLRSWRQAPQDLAPTTVADVHALAAAGRLTLADQIGTACVREITAALLRAGLPHPTPDSDPGSEPSSAHTKG
ncbi:hypothetical protein [Spirillospora sp. CA-294931]|uniref:hypothetical protein n=1 Tax=Spirillospora sp. CA-294931 TaxID=3240042 RepID=UPI003D936C19